MKSESFSFLYYYFLAIIKILVIYLQYIQWLSTPYQGLTSKHYSPSQQSDKLLKIEWSGKSCNKTDLSAVLGTS